MANTKRIINPSGKKSGAWIIVGTKPPIATSGIEVFYGEKRNSAKESTRVTGEKRLV